jgi:hypothetical protein
MSLVQGSQSLASGVDTASVVYPSAFAATPEVILVTVENTSGDAVKLAIGAVITASSTTGFTVGLSQTTNTANYNLVWYVSDTGTITELVQLALKGRRVSDLNVLNVLANDDYFPVVKAYPTPHTKRVKWSRIKALVEHAELNGIQGGAAGELYHLTAAQLARVNGIPTDTIVDLSNKQDILAEGAFVDGDKTKLDGIEALADVTDTANVTSAGALMDSEVTNLAQVKAFDSADYLGATAQAADVNPAGTAIAAALSDKAGIADDVDFTGNPSFADLVYIGDRTRPNNEGWVLLNGVDVGQVQMNRPTATSSAAVNLKSVGVDFWTFGINSDSVNPEAGCFSIRELVTGNFSLWVSRVDHMVRAVTGLVTAILKASATTGLVVQDSAGTTVATFGETGEDELVVDGDISGGTFRAMNGAGAVIGSNINVVSSVELVSADGMRLRQGGDNAILENLRDLGNLYLRAFVSGNTAGDLYLNDIGGNTIVPILKALATTGLVVQNSVGTEKLKVGASTGADVQVTGDLSVSGSIDGTAADVDPAGTAIAAALAAKVNQDDYVDAVGIDETFWGFALSAELVPQSDPRLSDAREWTASTIVQAEAETGTATTRRAWTSQRVRQAVESWWTTITDVVKTSGNQSIAGQKRFTDALRIDTSILEGASGASVLEVATGVSGFLTRRIQASAGQTLDLVDNAGTTQATLDTNGLAAVKPTVVVTGSTTLTRTPGLFVKQKTTPGNHNDPLGNPC